MENDMDTNDNKLNHPSEEVENVEKDPIEMSDNKEPVPESNAAIVLDEMEPAETGEATDQAESTTDVPAENEQPESKAECVFRWEYVQQSYYDKQAQTKGGKVAGSSRSKGGLVYGFIMTVAFLLAFSLLVVSLSIDDVSKWFKPTEDEKLSVEEIVWGSLQQKRSDPHA